MLPTESQSELIKKLGEIQERRRELVRRHQQERSVTTRDTLLLVLQEEAELKGRLMQACRLVEQAVLSIKE